VLQIQFGSNACAKLLPKTAAVSRSFRGASRARGCLISHYSRAHYHVTGPFCPFPVRLPLAKRGAHERRGKTVAPYRSPCRGTDGRMGFRTVSYVDRGPRVDDHVNQGSSSTAEHCTTEETRSRRTAARLPGYVDTIKEASMMHRVRHGMRLFASPFVTGKMGPRYCFG